MNPGKRMPVSSYLLTNCMANITFLGAKRIGLLFSEAKADWNLDPSWTADIEDISSGGEVFSDGCGLISKRFAVALSKHKKVIFRGRLYTPCVFQIR